MKFECSGQELYAGLTIVTRALAAKPVNSILEGVSLTVNPDGIDLVCSDGSMTITSHVNATVAEGGTIVLPGRLFTEIMRKMPGGNTVFTVNDRLVMTIKAGGSRASITGTDAEFPEAEDISTIAPIHLNREVFGQLVAGVSFAMAPTESRAQLTGCYMELTKDELRLVALDGFRLALRSHKDAYILPEGTDKVSAIIPGRVINEIEHLLSGGEEDMATFRFTKSHIMLNIGENCLVSSLLAGEYINYRQILPSSWLTRVTVGRRDLQDAVDRASLIAREGKNNLIKLEAKKGTITITANSEMGDSLEELEGTIEGEDILIAFNSRYVTDVLKNLEEENVTLCMNTNVSPCVIRPFDGDDYLYLILPVRVYG